MGEDYRIRPASRADAPALSEIERVSFSDPWSPAGFRQILDTPRTFGFVAEGSGRILGYLFGREVDGEAEILNLAVGARSRRRGIGSALLRTGLSFLAARGVREVFLEVRASNQAAQRLYAANGFTPVGLRAGYYRNPPEDALVLRRAHRSSA